VSKYLLCNFTSQSAIAIYTIAIYTIAIYTIAIYAIAIYTIAIYTIAIYTLNADIKLFWPTHTFIFRGSDDRSLLKNEVALQ